MLPQGAQACRGNNNTKLMVQNTCYSEIGVEFSWGAKKVIAYARNFLLFSPKIELESASLHEKETKSDNFQNRWLYKSTELLSVTIAFLTCEMCNADPELLHNCMKQQAKAKIKINAEEKLLVQYLFLI